MSVLSLAAWAFDRRLAVPSLSSARDRDAESALRRLLVWGTPAAAAFATLAAGAGVAFRDRPTVFGGLVLVAAVAMVPLLFRGLAVRLLARLEGASTERDILQADLEAAHRTRDVLRDLAYHDDLTGLPNRSLLNDRLGVAIAHARRQASHLALLFLDLDDFKAVNDSLGHGAGDRLLVKVAGRVRGSIRAGDTVARFGGDEFIVLLDSVTGPEDAARVAAKVIDAVRAPIRLDGHDLHIEASVGVSVYPRDGSAPDELVKSADAAMYRDKHRRAPMSRDGRIVSWPSGDGRATRLEE
jgi:diguanylate cyclase (GGDEF)-like protein